MYLQGRTWGLLLPQNVTIYLPHYTGHISEEHNLDAHRRDNLISLRQHMFNIVPLNMAFYRKTGHERFILAP
jgi:hypothetical protein